MMGLLDSLKKTPVEKPAIRRPKLIPRTGTLSSKNFRSLEGRVTRYETFSFSTMRTMMEGPLIQFGFNFLTLPTMQARFEINGVDAEQRDFIDKVFLESEVLNDTIQRMRYGVPYGFAPFELIWKEKTVDGKYRIVPRVPQLLRWEDSTLMEFDEGLNLGDIKGVHYQNRGASKITVDLLVKKYKAMWFTWQYGNAQDRYGYPQLKSAWDPWRFRRYVIFQDMPHYLERKADPPYLGKYPEGTVLAPDDSGETQNADYMLEILGHIRNGANVVIPSEAYEEYNAPRWDVTEMSTDDRTPVYDTANSRVYVPEILRAFLVPERALVEGQYGTKAESESHAEQLGYVQNSMLSDFLKVINDYMVRPCLAFNFPNPDPRLRFVHAPIRTTDQAAKLAVVQGIIEKWKETGEIDDITNDRLAEITGFRLYSFEPPERNTMVPGFGDVKINDDDEPLGEHMNKQIMDRHTHFEDPRVTLEADEIKLARKPCEQELEFYTEKQLVIMLTRQIEDEANLINDLEGIVADQRRGAEAFVRKTWQDTQDNHPQRMPKINKFILRRKGDERRIIREWIREQTYNAAYNAFEEQGALGMFPMRLTGIAATWASAEAQQIFDKLVTNIEAKVKTVLLEAVSRDAGVEEAVKVSNDIFRGVITVGAVDSVTWLLSGLANACIAHGREMLLERKRDGSFRYNGTDELEDENEIVATMRSAVMDINTCKVCKGLDKKILEIDDPRVNEYKAPQLCQGNWPRWGTRCRCLQFYFKRSMRPEFREPNVPAYPAPLLPPSMRTGAF